MKNKGTKILWAMSLPVILLASCASSEEKRWSYGKDEMPNFISIEAKLTKNGDGTATFLANADGTIFNTDITKKDVIVYDIDSAINSLSNSKKGYADYSVLKAASVNVTKIETNENKSGFAITFADSNAESYGMLINSSVTTYSQYVMVSEAEKDFDDPKDPQAEFEDRYISSKVTWEDGGKFVYQLISGIGTIIVGVATENPATLAGGIFSLLGTLSESLLSGGPTMKDIMDQLRETDRKIDELSAKIDRNTQQLADEIVRAEAMVDQANLNTLNLAINDFATNCLSPINNFNRDLADEVGFYYRDYVKSSQTVELRLVKNDDGEWESEPLGDMKGSTNFSLTISDFDNARDHLSKHNNIVEEGFMEELGKDIEVAIEGKKDLPEGIEKETLRDFVASMIYEEFCKQYFSANIDKAKQYRNYMIDCAERISGLNGKISILNSYFSRLQYMFNFAGEIKDSVRTLTANILQFLDMNTARASEACLFAEIMPTDLAKDFKTARETLQNFYNNIKELPDTYSFTTSAALTGGWYKTRYELSYSNPGNKCNLNVKFKIFNQKWEGIYLNDYEDDISKHYSLSAVQHARIATRWNLLRSSGVIESDSDYIHYLYDSKVISEESIKAAETCFNWHHAVSSCYRILTSDRAERELNISDTSTWMLCIAQGNPGGDYFTVGKEYGYREKHDSSSWYGRIFESTFVYAATGGSAGNQRICMWARYAESHWYWVDDEYWAFKNLDNTNYFFSIDIVTD